MRVCVCVCVLPSGPVGFSALGDQTLSRALKRGFDFNIMVAGQSGLGKSTFVNTLFQGPVSRVVPGDIQDFPTTVTTETIHHGMPAGRRRNRGWS